MQNIKMVAGIVGLVSLLGLLIGTPALACETRELEQGSGSVRICDDVPADVDQCEVYEIDSRNVLVCVDPQFPGWHAIGDDSGCLEAAQQIAPCADLERDSCDDFWAAHESCMTR